MSGNGVIMFLTVVKVFFCSVWPFMPTTVLIYELLIYKNSIHNSLNSMLYYLSLHCINMDENIVNLRL